MKVILHSWMLSFCLLMGCVVDEIIAPNPSADSQSSWRLNIAYKPFARKHASKFSLGDFDSPYLIQLSAGVADFALSDNSEVLLNDVPFEVNKTDYQGDSYLGIASFRFSDYSSFISTNDELTIKVNLVASDGTYTLSNETITSDLMVTKATNLYTWQDLQGMKHDLAGKYVLMNDITFPSKGREGLEAAGFDPVGDANDSFTGSFAGNGHRINNFSINRPMRAYVGIWGYVNDADSVIKDFVLDHAGITGNETIGGVAALLSNGMISRVGVVSSQNSSISGNDGIGGLVSGNFGTITNSYATVDVSGNDFLGGLVGGNFGTLNGYATGDVSGNNAVGGLVSGNIEGTVNGYATGAVSGNLVVGGLVGVNENGTVNGYATGEVSGNVQVGGLVGFNLGTGTVNGYWDQRSSGENDGTGRNEATFNGVGISSITNVVFSTGTTPDTYTDNKGTTITTDDVRVFTNAAFLRHFDLPRRSGEWPTLKATP